MITPRDGLLIYHNQKWIQKTQFDSLRDELEAAQKEIERLREENEQMMRTDYWHERYSAERTKVENLKSELIMKLAGSRAGRDADVAALTAIYQTREQGLVACLEMFVGYCTDEFAPTPMKIARELLKAHKGGA